MKKSNSIATQVTEMFAAGAVPRKGRAKAAPKVSSFSDEAEPCSRCRPCNPIDPDPPEEYMTWEDEG